MLSPVIKEHIEVKYGKPVRYHSDLEYLSFDIEKVTRQSISINTLKRLFGFIDGVTEPRLYTLDTLALYLGYSNWDVYLLSLNESGNSGFNSLHEVNVNALEISTVVQFAYEPDRIVQVSYEGNQRFRVVLSKNSKLCIDDLLEITHFVLHYPLVILNVVRGNKNIGRFTAGRVGGLTDLKIMTD